MKKLYIIAGCNGAGKTSASKSVLPELLDCKEFVNADEIAQGLSPFNPEKVSLQAGKLMLKRIDYLIDNGISFAFETTLSAKIYQTYINKAKKHSYKVILLFFWINSHHLAIKRVENRVKEGGHNIPTDLIIRRYERGLVNFFTIYKNLVDEWMFWDNTLVNQNIIAIKDKENTIIFNKQIWNNIEMNYGK